eukprot:9481145-Pyramimonas_sp.AAC.1
MPALFVSDGSIVITDRKKCTLPEYWRVVCGSPHAERLGSPGVPAPQQHCPESNLRTDRLTQASC